MIKRLPAWRTMFFLHKSNSFNPVMEIWIEFTAKLWMETDILEKSSSPAVPMSLATRLVLVRKSFLARLLIQSNVNAADKVSCIFSTVWNRTLDLKWRFWKLYCVERSIVGFRLERIERDNPSKEWWERLLQKTKTTEKAGTNLLICVHGRPWHAVQAHVR